MQDSHRTNFKRLLGAGLLVLAMAGCKTENQHDEWVDQADNRWLTLRSGVMLDMASQQFESGDLEMAQKTLSEAMQMDANNPRLHVLAGRILLEQGQLERSYHVFNAAIDLEEKLPEAYYYQGLVLQRWQEYQRAHDNYRRAYELEADNAAYLLARVEMLVQLNQLEEATQILQAKLNYFDQNATMRSALGHLLVMQGQPALAVAYFQQSATLDPDDLRVQEELAMAQLGANQNEQAAMGLERLLADPKMQTRYDLHRLLARTYIKLDRLDLARSAYLNLARGSAGEATDWIKLAELAWRQNDHPATLHAATRAIDMAPRRHEGYLLAGMVWQKRGRLDEALSMFDRAAERAPDDAMPLILRGLSLQKANRLAAAAEAYEAALQRQPDNPRVQRLLQSVAGTMQ